MPNSPSTPRVASSASPDVVVDTVVLRYFLLVDAVELLLSLVGSPVGVPRIVYDPEEEEQAPDDARSEITRSIGYQQKVSRDRARDASAREEAARCAIGLQAIAAVHDGGALAVLDLGGQELRLVAQLTSPESCKAFGLRFALGPGEAACLAIAVQRDLVLVTDDTDALRALERYRPGHPYERIRRLLVRAGESRLCTRERANEIHREMRRLGFWDRGEPFPAGS